MNNPLAARMRPRSLDEFVGQADILGPGRLLRRAILADQLTSLIFFGPPGTGKTTLAQIIANTTQAQFITINAVLGGVKDIRAAIAQAQKRRTVLFIDEVHRFNKAQQDALLPWVEKGTVILIGATTENPYFEVNPALVSRSRLFRLQSLTTDNLRQIVDHALRDPERGYGDRTIELAADALDHWVKVANGDARAILNALELAVETTPPQADGAIALTLRIAEDSIQQRAILYDKDGDAHFDTISAFIKSVRGSDPDAALYWLARMLYAGESPRFILRRLLILASEDIGLAEPGAVGVVNACAAAFDRVGMPEGRYPLTQATLYLATAPKSNSAMSLFDALKAVEQEQATVPLHLRDANRDKAFGDGAGYKYPHTYQNHWVAQQYLPDRLQGQVFYQPSAQGYEGQRQAEILQRRELQWALETPETPVMPLSASPEQRGRDRWLEQTFGTTSEQLQKLRSRLFKTANLQRHHLVLDLNGGRGLLTSEALRQVPEGGVYVRANAHDFASLSEQFAYLNPLEQPQIFTAELQDLARYLQQQFPNVHFDWAIGRNVLMGERDKAIAVQNIVSVLNPKSRLVLVENIPRFGQRLSHWFTADDLDLQLHQRWQAAEEALYLDEQDPLLNWQPDDLVDCFEEQGCVVTAEVEQTETDLVCTASLLKRWLTPNQTPKPSYITRLATQLSPEEIEIIQQILGKCGDRAMPWQGQQVWLIIEDQD
ncbi:MAG: AAA family ATPase [Cyanobacteria bacterium P01_G01_bin.54]